MNQGQTAVSAGREAEDIIAGHVMRMGCRAERQVYIGLSIYNEPTKVDFIMYGLKDYPDGLIVESKWQTSAGSVDEKFPYLVLNVKEVYPLPTIIVLTGDGYRPGAERWLKRQVDQQLVAVMNLVEFITWMSRCRKAGKIIKQTLC
jgi:hypothetical protein